MANNGIYYSSGNTLNFTTNNTTWATLTSGGTFVISTVSGGTYLNLPASTGSTSGAYLPLSGGTVTGGTIFQSGLTANTISATTYYNLPYSGTVNGGGTSNYVPKWTGSTGLGDSQIYDNGTFVGIGVTAQTYSELLSLSGNGGIVINSFTFVADNSGSIAIADGDYTTWGSGGNEIAIGSGSPLLNSTGSYNIAIGYASLSANTTGFDNVAIGNTSLNVNTTGLENVAIGHGALSDNQAGQGNVSLGYHAGSGLTSGSWNVFLGYKAGGNETTGDNRLFIANTYEKTLIYGEFDNNKVGINTTTPIASLDVSGSTRIEGSLTANTISATTYYNLPPATFSGGTVTGPTNFTNGLTANTISATTYYNLPISGLTSGTGIGISGSNGNYTISYTGSTSGGTSSGDYLPLSGGTVTGGTIFQSGVTANTISQTSYIDFTTGSTNPSSVAGRVFFDSTQKALSYFDIINNQVPIAMGQQLYTRVWNATGVQIDKGKVIAITGTTNGLPSAILAVNQHAITSARPIGLTAENIPNGSEGLVLNNGILSGITLNTFANGDTLYLSDTVPGGYVNTTSSLSFTARTNEIGYVIETGSTTGKIYVNINNEDSNLSLTDIERNILEGNVISSGVYQYTGMTQGTGQTINVALARGWIVRNTYEFSTLPDVTNVYYTGGTNIPITNLASADATFILINSASTLVQQTTFPTAQQRRENIFLGKVVHPLRTSITSINQTVDFDVSPMAAIRDLWTPLKLINQGIIVSPHSTTLEIDTSAGTLWGNGIGWTTNQLNPDSISISGTSPTTFQYRTRLGPLTGGTVPSGNTTTIYPGYYDVGGVVTAVGGGSNSATNQRVFLFPTGLVRIQLGQQVYGTLAEAVAGSQTEQFTEYSLNRENGILIGIISLNKSASDLSNAAQAVFNLVSKFGEILGGTGGLSTTTLQQAYDNSVTPEIVTNSAEGALSVQNGTGAADNVTNLFEGKNSGGTTTSLIRADGAFSGTSIFGTGLTATTISATTYQNLPSFNYVQITGTTQFSAGTNNNLNFSGINMTITSGSNNTLIFSAGTEGGGAVSSVTAGSGLSGNSTTGAITLINTQVQGITGITSGAGITATTTNNVTTITNLGVTGFTAGYGVSADTSTGNVTIVQVFDYGRVYTTANNFNFI